MRNVNLIPFVCNFSNAVKGVLDIHIDGAIVDAQTQAVYREWFGDDSTVSFMSFRNEVKASDAKTINVYINSGGGHLIDAMAIHDLLIDEQAKGKTVNTFGRGLVGSAATYILMAGNNPEMSENSWFMIHNVSGGMSGTVDEMEGYVKTLRKFNNAARDFYAQRTGKRPEDITRLMDAETWFTAKDAKANNFIKQVSNEVTFNNKISQEAWQSFNFTNLNVLNAYNSFAGKTPTQSQQDPADLENAIQQIIMKKSFLTGFINALKGVKPEATATPEEIVNNIVAVLQPMVEAVPDDAEPVDNTAVINQAVTAAVNTANAAFENRLKTVEGENTKLAAKNLALIAQLETALGKQTNDAGGAAEEKPAAPVVGRFGAKK